MSKPPLPRYKRDSYIFISNLKTITADPAYPLTFKRDGYLLSEHYHTSTLEALAKVVKQKRNLLISDNGNFTRMKNIAKLFAAEAEDLLTRAESEKEELGAVSGTTHQERKDLIKRIEEACLAALQDDEIHEIVAKQVSIDPDYMIGMEDFTIPVMLLTGLMAPVFDPQPEEIKPYQQKTVELYQRQQAGEFGSRDQLKGLYNFLVVHASDFRSAAQGAALAEEADPDGLAVSFGGPMSSRRWITSLNLGEKTVNFDEKLPEPYLLSTALTMGISKGLTKQFPVHILGTGTPILIALLANILPGSKAISIDSTSPFKDSNDGNLYGSRYAFLKMDMYKVAAYALINNKPYTSRTPFFKAFEADFPSDWKALRAELGVTSSADAKTLAETLQQEMPLVERFIPFFSKMRSGDDEMINRLRMDRSGHNYWILRNICVSIRDRIADRAALEKWTAYQVERYEKVAHPKWAKAVRQSLEISRGIRD